MTKCPFYQIERKKAIPREASKLFLYFSAGARCAANILICEVDRGKENGGTKSAPPLVADG